MNAYKMKFITTGAVLAASLLLFGCERSPDNTQTDGVGLAVNSEDGSGDDLNVTQAVDTALRAEQRLRYFDIEVEARKGDVRLTGTVDTKEESELAERIATGVSGVHGVNNELKINQ